MIYAVDYEEQVNRSINKKDSATPVLWCVLQLNPVQGCGADVQRVKGGEIYVHIFLDQGNEFWDVCGRILFAKRGKQQT